MKEENNLNLNRFWDLYYLLRLLSCFPVLVYPISIYIPLYEPQTSLIPSYQHTLTLTLLALPVLVFLRLKQIRSKFHLLSLSPETVLDAWLNHFIAYNVAFLAFLGGWITASTYLASVLGLRIFFPKPVYLGESKLRVLAPESFALEVLNRTYSSVIGFSPSELLDLTPQNLQKERHDKKANDDGHFQSKTWIIWPITESSKRSQVGLIDMESILASLSLQYHDLNKLEFVILDLQNSLSLCSSLKIWTEDDMVSPHVQCENDDLVLLKYQAGKEISRIPQRKLCEEDSSDDEEPSIEKLTQKDEIYWNKETILRILDLK